MPPLPAPDDFTRPFWDAVRDGRLTAPRCTACSGWFFVPEPLCPHCGEGSWTWEQSGGEGEIYSLSVVHQTVSPDQPTPFVLAEVDLDEGWTILTHVIGSDPETVRIGDRVSFAPTRKTDEISLPTFEKIAP
jgi:uncharacterized OB-fold protein